MTTTHKQAARGEPKGKARRQAELVELTRMLHRAGAVGDDELAQTTMAMLGRAALPKVAPLSPRQIVGVREQLRVSQAVLAGYLNVSVSTVSQWERGDRRPSGAALKLLHVVKARGLEVLR